MENLIIFPVIFSLMAGAMLYGYFIIANEEASVFKELIGFAGVILAAFAFAIFVVSIQRIHLDSKLLFISTFVMAWSTLSVAVPRLVIRYIKGNQLSLGFFFRISGYFAVLAACYRAVPDEAIRWSVQSTPMLALFYVVVATSGVHWFAQLQIVLPCILTATVAFTCLTFGDTPGGYFARFNRDPFEFFALPSLGMAVLSLICCYVMRQKKRQDALAPSDLDSSAPSSNELQDRDPRSDDAQLDELHSDELHSDELHSDDYPLGGRDGADALTPPTTRSGRRE